MHSKLHIPLNAQGNSQQAGLPTFEMLRAISSKLVFPILPPSSSASCRVGWEGKKQERSGKGERQSPPPARARLILGIMHARRVLLIINLTTPTINPTMVSNNYRLTLGGGLLWSHVCQGEGGQ